MDGDAKPDLGYDLRDLEETRSVRIHVNSFAVNLIDSERDWLRRCARG